MKIQLAALAFGVLASTQTSAQETDKTDLSRYQIFEDDERAVTLSELQKMEDKYVAAIAEQDCNAALPSISEFSVAANRLSNLIRRGNEPFYDATRDDRQTLGRDQALLNELIAAENTTNQLIKQRNRAWVEEAKCLLEEGNSQAAITRLYRALDYIDSDERELWEEARKLLWEQVGYSPE
ncbi:hypothetical protein JQV19_18935 [Sulfitobacter mediterraneus]|uniref:hypothetical protein n=1 Tax=Sulfitobacter mediterraneus TaxID=83219 RepID=UPI001939EE93|nr:hypothetical protein [Sulfitobacter mediterraneus]MBM1558700.1 hypothetical protein [Sulfitobacter mediterraneus]MBM1570071.1 hypothetical protein [Sulfitobacter mediterraneus]MBM1574028.1 hypothetical protein [Sulfitobacter mediterraneus]MBM1577793.1 hypothetical protein [Sulfitobacter mediterraneus]MBM1581689.1 hypothetical protein [Sulfitobacter mediterraneus]